MDENMPLFIPVILGTARKGRMSNWAARLVWQEVTKRPNVETELIDITALPLESSRRKSCSYHWRKQWGRPGHR
jgi:hypothetical protein